MHGDVARSAGILAMRIVLMIGRDETLKRAPAAAE